MAAAAPKRSASGLEPRTTAALEDSGTAFSSVEVGELAVGVRLTVTLVPLVLGVMEADADVMVVIVWVLAVSVLDAEDSDSDLVDEAVAEAEEDEAEDVASEPPVRAMGPQ
jgi:hypothetical protein